MIVADTNTIVYFWLNGTYNQFAQNLLKSDPDWIAPFLWRSEFRNVLAGYIRKEMMTLEDANELCLSAEEQLKNKEYLVTSDLILELVSTSNCSAYDCEYVALAKEFNIKLVTSDKKILKEFPETTIPLNQFK